MCPTSAVRGRSSSMSSSVGTAAAKASSQLARAFRGAGEEISRILPPGAVRIVERVRHGLEKMAPALGSNPSPKIRNFLDIQATPRGPDSLIHVQP